jgi:MscS family membrane protein
MEEFQKIMNHTILENRISELLWFVGLLVAGLILKKTVAHWIGKATFRLIRRETSDVPIKQFYDLICRPLEWFILFSFLYFAFEHLTVPPYWGLKNRSEIGLLMLLEKGFLTSLMITLTWLGIRLIRFGGIVAARRAALTPSPLDDQLVPFLKDISIFLWIMMCFFIILNQIYNVNVLALVTSLGIGGLAIALAARDTIENLIASVAIMIGRPFIIGDTVSVNQVTGDVEKVGFRSTRLRTDDGSLATIPNRMMVSQTVDNLTQRSFRRAKLFVRLNFDTRSETLSTIRESIQSMIETYEIASYKPITVRLDSLGEQSWEILVIFNVKTTDWKLFMQIKEEINLKIIDIVNGQGATFAHTGQLYLSANEQMSK